MGVNQIDRIIILAKIYCVHALEDTLAHGMAKYTNKFNHLTSEKDQHYAHVGDENTGSKRLSNDKVTEIVISISKF